MPDVDGIEGVQGLSQQAGALESSLQGAQAMMAAFDAELARVRETMMFTSREVSSLSSSLSRGLGRAFDGVVFEGLKLSDALKSVAETMAQSVYRIALKPVEDAVGGALSNGLNGLLSGLFPFANGAGFAQGRVMPFARGGVVGQPTLFPMRNGTGLMGESGPEAILPLSRGSDGRLGVQAGGGRQVHVTVNVTTPDARSFERSRSQIAAQMARALAHGERNA